RDHPGHVQHRWGGQGVDAAGDRGVAMSELFTVGHSNGPVEALIRLLEMHRITAIADVRSSPYSRYAPQFNREALHPLLTASGIQYVYLGAELGARRSEPA